MCRTHPAGFADRLGADYARLDLSDRERAVLDYAAKLTRTPSAMVEQDLSPLQQVSLTDRDILDLNLCVAYFAYVNRIADGLGVRLEPYWAENS